MNLFKGFKRAPLVAEAPVVTMVKQWNAVQLDIASAHSHVIETDMRRRLQVMADILATESRRLDDSTTGPCLEFFLKQEVMGKMVSLSSSNTPEGLRGEVIRFFASLVVLLDERFLVHIAVHRPLLKLLRECILPDGSDGLAAVSSEYEVDLVDLLSFVANRIRSFPELLPVFFLNRNLTRRGSRDKTAAPATTLNQRNSVATVRPDGTFSPTPSEQSTTAPSSSGQASLTRSTTPGEYEFLVFGYLMRFLHREGRIGDLARAGLLFLVDVAMSAGMHPLAQAPPIDLADATLALAEYLLDSDLAEVLAAGLGAIYGLLPSKLVIQPAAGSLMLSAASRKQRVDEMQDEARLDDQGLTSSSSSETQVNLQLLLKLVAFVQDVLQRAPLPSNSSHSRKLTSSATSAIPTPVMLVGACFVENVLTALRKIFLGSVLYPSILECSDQDGSGVAVLTYLDAVLSRIDGDSALAFALLEFLAGGGAAFDKIPLQSAYMSNEDQLDRLKKSAIVPLQGAKRRSDISHAPIVRYTLKDLLLLHLESPSMPARAAALHLICSLQTYHPTCAVAVLEFDLQPLQMRLLEDPDIFVYSEGAPVPHSRSDAGALLLRHFAEMRDLLGVLDLGKALSENDVLLALKRYEEDAEHAVCQARDDSGRKRGQAGGPVFEAIMRLLSGYFSNSPDVNLALTGVLAAITACPSHVLDGWMLPLWSKDAEAALSTAAAASDPLPHHYDGDDRSIDHIVENRNRFGLIPPVASIAPRWGGDRSSGRIFRVFGDLDRQIQGARNRVANFNTLLGERESSLLFVDSLAEALTDVGAKEQLAPKQADQKSTGEPLERVGSTDNPFAAHYALTATAPCPLGVKGGSLSGFLDNVVILAEGVKELVAIIQCRRALGIDVL